MCIVSPRSDKQGGVGSSCYCDLRWRSVVFRNMQILFFPFPPSFFFSWWWQWSAIRGKIVTNVKRIFAFTKYDRKSPRKPGRLQSGTRCHLFSLMVSTSPVSQFLGCCHRRVQESCRACCAQNPINFSKKHLFLGLGFQVTAVKWTAQGSFFFFFIYLFIFFSCTEIHYFNFQLKECTQTQEKRSSPALWARLRVRWGIILQQQHLCEGCVLSIPRCHPRVEFSFAVSHACQFSFKIINLPFISPPPLFSCT